VGRAVYELLFPVARIFQPEEIEKIATALAAEPRRLDSTPPTYLLGPSDGGWDLEIRRSGLLFRLYDYQAQDGTRQFEQLVELGPTFLDQDAFEKVALWYSNTVPVESGKVKDLLAERVVELLSDPGETFTQEVRGTWNLGHYRLQYGIQPLHGETLYLSEASVSAEHVAPGDLGDVLCDLEEEGLRLLAWPITSRARRELEFGKDLPAPPSLPKGLPFEDANRERIQLLVRKFGSEDLSFEDESRLAALTERVRYLVPLVAREERRSVEAVATRLENIEDRTRRVRARHGLSG
jgi:hypothetical protein